MHFHEAMLSLLTNRQDFSERLLCAIEQTAPSVMTPAFSPGECVITALRGMLSDCERVAKDLIIEALRKLKERSGHVGMWQETDSIKLDAGAGLVDMDWGKSELQGDRLTIRLIATHASMPKDPVIVDRTMQIT